QTIPETFDEIGVRECAPEPAQRPGLRGKCEDRAIIEGRDRHHDAWQQHEQESGGDEDASRPSKQHGAGSALHVVPAIRSSGLAAFCSNAIAASDNARPMMQRLAAKGKLNDEKPS